MNEACIIPGIRGKRGYALVKRWSTGASLAGPVIIALAALDAAGYSVIAPALPAISDATGAGPALIGALVATFPAGALVGFALAGPGVRRGRTRAVLACSLLVVAVGSLGFVVSDDLAVLFPARTLMGLGSGGLWMGVTFATLERAPGQEYLGMSRLLAAYSAGSLIGPALGAIGGIRGPFAVYLALVLVGLLALPFLRPPRERRTFSSDWSALRLPGFWFACAAGLVAVIGLGIIEGVLPLHLAAELSQAQIGGLYAGLALLLAGTAVAAGYAAPRLVIAVGTALLVVGIALTGLADAPAYWLACLAVAGIGFGLTETGSAGALFEAVETERIVTAMIVWSQIGIVGYLLGPLAGGAVAEGLSFAWIGIVPILAAAALAVLALALRGRYAAAAGSTAASARNGTRNAGPCERR
jgi:MFS family permease